MRSASKRGSAVGDNKLPDFREHDRDIQAVGTAAGLGFSLVASLVFFIAGGAWLDSWLDTAPVLTLVGVALGLVAAGYQLYELTLLGKPDRENGPIGRALERRASAKSRRR